MDPNSPFSSIPEADQQLRLGLDLKARGELDAALTAFRRAVIADPSLVPAHLEAGLLLKEKSKTDPLFLRHAFDSFRRAARGDKSHEEAHNQYILAATKLGLIGELHGEYTDWVKSAPDNPLLQKSLKNVTALSLAMMPDRVNLAPSGAGSMRKITLIISLILLLGGGAVTFLPILMNRDKKWSSQQVRGFVGSGIGMAALGFGGLFLRSRLR